ncbi:YicC/YloC family endoribonuclease [Notoacmeibacter ruber]|uniref:YicC family protein n=1 Tax=Notoacmeibacter ruber TaxID=2670375 RepID=A0A3L7JAI4_9HYPH|nr:YicC/YloC family endoribonuclease [Notoacmeibacter ruber]RLQ87636.1 YicC family protein [Notoacmeibacter ruber]
MALRSMTGFGSAEGLVADRSLRFELKSVNGRGLDVRLRMPSGLDHLGPKIRDAARKWFARGTLHVGCTLSEVSGGVSINREVLARFSEEARRLEQEGFAPARADGLLALRGVIDTADTSLSADDEARQQIDTASLALFEKALTALSKARIEEGLRLQSVISRQVGQIAELAAKADEDPSRRPEAIAERLKAQVETLLGTSAALDSARLHAEAALLATRADIREELDRIFAHCDAVAELFEAEEPVGRRLDFLAQELGRESNTLCAKANSAALTAIGLDMKVVVDQLREQVQNVE